MSDYLPDEVLSIIFFKLPAKTVLDCRCVCKFWCSVISNSNFLCNYNKLSFNNKNNKRLLLCHYEKKLRKEIFTSHSDDKSFGHQYEELELPFDHGLSRYMIIGFCCGLVCLLEISKSGRLPKSLLIWNPSVGYSFKTFPIEPPVGRIFQQYPGSGYGPSVRFTEGEEAFVSSFGFGFDFKSNDYKVVRIVYRLENTCVGSKRVIEIVDVFALSIGEWEDITESAPPYVIKENSAPACVNGAVHWVGYYDGSDERVVSQMIVSVFDLNDEVFKEFKLPDSVMRETNEFRIDEMQKISVGVINQSLALIHHHTNSNSYVQFFYRCGIWVMNEYGATESWTKLYDVNSHLGLGKMLGLRRNGEVLVGTVHKGKLLAIHPKGRRSRHVNVRGEPWSFYMDAFMECVVIYKKVNGVPTMSTNSDAITPIPALGAGTSSYKQALGVGSSGIEKGKEILEEEEEEEEEEKQLWLALAQHGEDEAA